MARVYSRSRSVRYSDVEGRDKLRICENCGEVMQHCHGICENCGAVNRRTIRGSMRPRGRHHRSDGDSIEQETV